MKQIKDVYVIGHKNPDTDSICSAIAYAWLKNQLGERHYVAKRAGQISSETEFVLNYFKSDVPTYINDVRAQVKDAVLESGKTVGRNMSLKNAWQILKENHLATLAVIDEEKKFEGLITVGDIARSFMGVYDNRILSNAKTPYKNLVETLEGELVVGDISRRVEKGKVLIAAANPDLMEKYIDEGDIVILSDRYESQLCAIEMNASCLIVCLGSEVSPAIVELARDKGCAIIKTDYDTFIAARLMNQSIPISYFMVRDNLITFKPEEFAEDVRKIMANKRHRDFPVLDENDCFIGMLTRHSLIEMDRKQLILVDHNERTQAVDGIEDADILEIVDHHKLGNVETLKPVMFRNQPVGCTSTIIYLMAKENGIEIPPQIAGLMCSAIISDTLLFRSPTCTPVDKRAACRLAEIAGIDAEKYAMEMFDAGSNLTSRTDEEIFYQDFKKFISGRHTYGVGQITSMNKDELLKVRGRIEAYMENVLESRGLEMVYFMLTDILDEATDLLCEGHSAVETVERAFGVSGENGCVHLDGVVSRKKQLIPRLMNELQG